MRVPGVRALSAKVAWASPPMLHGQNAQRRTCPSAATTRKATHSCTQKEAAPLAQPLRSARHAVLENGLRQADGETRGHVGPHFANIRHSRLILLQNVTDETLQKPCRSVARVSKSLLHPIVGPFCIWLFSGAKTPIYPLRIVGDSRTQVHG